MCQEYAWHPHQTCQECPLSSGQFSVTSPVLHMRERGELHCWGQTLVALSSYWHRHSTKITTCHQDMPQRNILWRTTTFLFLVGVGNCNNTSSGFYTLYVRSNACCSELQLVVVSAIKGAKWPWETSPCCLPALSPLHSLSTSLSNTIIATASHRKSLWTAV